MKNKLILAILILAGFTACESIRTAWSAQNRAATATRLQASATRLLGRSAVALLQAYATDRNPDFGHAAAAAVWASIDAGNISEAIRAAGGSPVLADTAESVAVKTAKGQPVKYDIIAAVAAAISSGALKDDVRGTPLLPK